MEDKELICSMRSLVEKFGMHNVERVFNSMKSEQSADIREKERQDFEERVRRIKEAGHI